MLLTYASSKKCGSIVHMIFEIVNATLNMYVTKYLEASI